MSDHTPEALAEFLIDGARYGEIGEVQEALSLGADVNSCDESGRTALHMACANGHMDILELLLEKGANTEAKNESESTPLHWACMNAQKAAVLRLLKEGASLSALNALGRTPIDEALPNGDLMHAIREFQGEAEDDLDDVEEAEAEEVVLSSADRAGPSNGTDDAGPDGDTAMP